MDAHLIDVLRARAEARARLASVGALDFHHAVDEMQVFATKSGLVARLGQDRVQWILAAAFAPYRDDGAAT